MKDFNDIQILLDRYWEGETTLEEERRLKTYFASGEVDERLIAFAPLFQALREEQSVQYMKIKTAPLKPVLYTWQKLAAAASVALLLTAGLWWWNSGGEKPVQQHTAQQPPLQEESLPRQENPDLQSVAVENTAHSEASKPSVPFKKAAPKHPKPAPALPKTVNEIDPETELAMEEIKAALALVSSKLKKGKQEAAKGAIYLENVDKILKKKSEG